MEYQKITNLLGNASNQPSKFTTKIWVKINDESRGTYSAIRQISFKTSMLSSRLCDYTYAYMPVKGKISINNTAAVPVTLNNRNRESNI